ncbi:MAG: hypoxanthine phosphoribosyltransferase [Armatimonadetes bacterium]|nr:hypoxanthine phosphoribosyltransferase [Armatimonadota bacterium]
MSLFPGEHLDVLITQDQIRLKVQQLGVKIRADYGEKEIILVAVLKGSYLFVADLARELGLNVKIEFCQVSSYNEGKSSTGVVQIRKDLDINIEGRDVLIIEDIVDTGLTLKFLKEMFEVRRPSSVKVCTLLSKPEARTHDSLVDYVGFEIPNEFVVGYGLDYGERFRTLPYIAILRDSS